MREPSQKTPKKIPLILKYFILISFNFLLILFLKKSWKDCLSWKKEIIMQQMFYN